MNYEAEATELWKLIQLVLDETLKLDKWKHISKYSSGEKDFLCRKIYRYIHWVKTQRGKFLNNKNIDYRKGEGFPLKEEQKLIVKEAAQYIIGLINAEIYAIRSKYFEICDPVENYKVGENDNKTLTN
jgi:hypothetical protein